VLGGCVAAVCVCVWWGRITARVAGTVLHQALSGSKAVSFEAVHGQDVHSIRLHACMRGAPQA
jgi:hypothetical protein